MNDYEEIENDDRLLQRLRREARRTTPAFSDELHEQVMLAVQSAAAALASTSSVASEQSRRASRSQALPWAMTAAASLALAIAIFLVMNRALTSSHESIANGGPATHGKDAVPALPDPSVAVEIARKDATAKKDPEKKGTDDIEVATNEIVNSASGIGDWMRSAAGDSQWGGLDHDAQRALATVAGPLPFDLTFSVATADPD